MELMILKRKQRKQQKERDEEQRLREEEERRARKAAKKGEERGVKAREVEARRHREAKYLESRSKRLNASKLQQIREEMEKIQAELKEETSKRDHARNARVLKRKEAVAKK